MNLKPMLEPESPSEEDLIDGIVPPVWRRNEDDEEIYEGDIKVGEPVLDENYGMLGYVKAINGKGYWNGDIVVAFRQDKLGDWIYAEFGKHSEEAEGMLRCSLD